MGEWPWPDRVTYGVRGTAPIGGEPRHGLSEVVTTREGSTVLVLIGDEAQRYVDKAAQRDDDVAALNAVIERRDALIRHLIEQAAEGSGYRRPTRLEIRADMRRLGFEPSAAEELMGGGS